MSDSFASSIAFSALPPMPMPSIPGGHQPAPIVGTVFRTQSTIESPGLSIANFALFSEPPPFAASRTSTESPGTSCTWITAGVLSRVFFRAKAGSATMEARKMLSGCRYARRTPSFTISSSDRVASQRTFMPTFKNTTTIPVSWQMGRCPSAHMREFVRICAIASLAAGDSSREYAAPSARM